MTSYRRIHQTGATYFFTVNYLKRHNNTLLIEHIDHLRDYFRKIKQTYPFDIEAIVILPEHIHSIWKLPEGDSDYKTRWSLIKSNFSRKIPIHTHEKRSISRIKRGERGIWLRDDQDFERHFHYIHWNPVKHGLVKEVKDWAYSSFHRYVKEGYYTNNWS